MVTLEIRKTPFISIELLATLVALQLWGEECKQRFIVSFIDNEASRAALVAWLETVVWKSAFAFESC